MVWKMLVNIFRFMEIVLCLKVQPPDFIGKLFHWIFGAVSTKTSSCIRRFETISGNNADWDYNAIFLNRNNSALTFQSAENCADTDSVKSDSKLEVEQNNVTSSEGSSESLSVSKDPKAVSTLCSGNKTDPQTVHHSGAYENLVSFKPENGQPRDFNEGQLKVIKKKQNSEQKEYIEYKSKTFLEDNDTCLEHEQTAKEEQNPDKTPDEKDENKIGDCFTSLRSSSKPMQVVDLELPQYVFHQCKEKMRPVKKSLIQLDFTEKGLTEQEQNILMECCILRLGKHIEKEVGEMADSILNRKWHEYLWMFVARFTDMDHITLQYIYEMAVTIRAQTNQKSKGKSECLTEKHMKKFETSTKDQPPFKKCQSDMDCDNYNKEKKQDQFCKDESCYQSDKYRSEHGCHKDTSSHESHKDKNYHEYCINETLHKFEKEKNHHKPHKDKRNQESHRTDQQESQKNEPHEDKRGYESLKTESHKDESEQKCNKDKKVHKSSIDKNCHDSQKIKHGHESDNDNNCKESNSHKMFCKRENVHKSFKDKNQHEHQSESGHESLAESYNQSYKNKNDNEFLRDRKRPKSHKHESHNESHRDERAHKYCKHESGLGQSVVDKTHLHEFHKDKSHSDRLCNDDNQGDQSSNQFNEEKNRQIDQNLDGMGLGDHQLQYERRPTANVSMHAASSNSAAVARDISSYQIPFREAGKKDISRQAATWTYASPLARVEPFIQSHYVRFKFKRSYTSSSPSRDCEYGSRHRDSNCSDWYNEHYQENQESHSSETERGERTSRKRKTENMTHIDRQIKSPRRNHL